ncbi:MAG: hypothetical protein FWC77_05160 [Defluviitaleaceae bacterium]|nr:hypothetical protein [Defluviitaleaceae bacterium]
MNEAIRRNNLLGLIVLFVVLTPVGVILSYFYIMFQINAHAVWINIIANFVFGILLFVLVWVIKRLMRVTNDFMSLFVVIISLAIIVFVMWNMWFALMVEILYHPINNISVFSDMWHMLRTTSDIIFGSGSIASQLRVHHIAPEGNFTEMLRYFNARGTWSLNGGQWTGLMLAAVWAGELLVIAVFPIMVAYSSVGLYLAEQGAWVQEKLMNYGFSAFDDDELDQLASGDIDVILQKPLESQGEPMHAIAVCYHKGEPTEFIAIYKAGWDRDGTLAKGRHIMTVKLGVEQIDALDAGLQAKHYPTLSDKPAKEDEPEDVTAMKEPEDTAKPNRPITAPPTQKPVPPSEPTEVKPTIPPENKE